MADPLRLFVLAGEPSGDRIGADLVARLRRSVPVEVTGVGGPELSAEGLSSLYPMDDLSVMGWADVLPRLPKLLARAGQTARAILAERPDVVVMIDAQAFSKAVAKRVRAANRDLPMVLYVAPSVWAWKPRRAPALTPLFDEVLAVLPFEPAVMRALGGPPTSYVGHPALASIPFRETLPKKGTLLLLPGSRGGELRRHLPLMRRIADRFAAHPAVDGLVLPTLPDLATRLQAVTAQWEAPVRVVSGREQRAAAFGDAIAAVAVTGTVTLELAVAGVPMVATYVADAGQGLQWVRFAIKYASLPNAILDQPLVPEVLGMGADVDRVAIALEALLAGPAALAQHEGFRRMRRIMETGTAEALREDPAARVLAQAGR